MDIYQSNLFNRGTIEFSSSSGNEKVEFNDEIILYQNKDYRIGEYKLIIKNDAIEEIRIDSKVINNSENNSFIIDIDFNEPPNSIIIKFKNGIADNCNISIKLIKADKEQFDKEESQKIHDLLIKNLALTMNSGVNCINILWKDSCGKVDKTVLDIYYLNNYEKYKIGTFETKEKFKSISGLGYGTYECNLKQLDSKGNIIIENSSSVVISDFTKAIASTLREIKVQVSSSGRHSVHN